MTTRALQALFLVVGLAAASPALAQHRGYYGPRYQPYPAYPPNALRLQIGGAGLGVEDAAGPEFENTHWGALVFGADFDLNLGGPVNLTLGAREALSSSFSGNPSVFEPAGAFTFKFTPYAPIQPRISVGVAGLFASNSDAGVAARFGGGLSFFGRAPLGLAMDVVFEVGQLGGVTFTQGEFLIGPEFRF